MRRSSVVAGVLPIAMFLSAASAEAAVPRWKKKLHKATRSRHLSVRIERGDKVLFDKRSSWKRIPASNQKLILSMALLDRLGPRKRFPTTAYSERKDPPFATQPKIDDGVLRSSIWVVGRGDPTLSGSQKNHARWLSVEATKVGDLARAIKAAGVTRVAGRVIGVRSYFKHDWWAPGWKVDFPREQVALPSALTLNGNSHEGHHISNPELRLATSLSKRLESKKIWVRGEPRSGSKPDGLTRLAGVSSQPLAALMGHMNRVSSNFFAEVFGKALAVDAGRRPGTIEKGATTLRRWARRRGVRLRAHDGSGLSYDNRVSARGIVTLLRRSERTSWWDELLGSLPKGGWGTLGDRLEDVRLRAKTGTLDKVSTLSGWMWLRKSDRWARFSIMVNGMATWDAKAREDEIVRLASRHFR